MGKRTLDECLAAADENTQLPLYAERNPFRQGEYRLRHVDRMTREALHSKADIADELAHRDMLIDDLAAHARELQSEMRSALEIQGVLREENKRLRAEAAVAAYAAQCGEPVAWKYGPEATRWHNAKTTQPEPKTVAAWGIEYAYAAPPPSPVSMAAPKVLFCPTRLPPPDEYGFFSHPDIHSIFGDDECDQGETAARLLSLGWEADYVSGDDLVDEDTLEYNVVGWRPEPPKGKGWRNVSVFDTEDGPFAMFVRPSPVSMVELEEALSVYGAERYADGAASCDYNERTEKARAEVLRLASQGVRPRVPEWQPIETAPKDGTSVLLLIDGAVHALHDDEHAVSIGSYGVNGGPEEDPTWCFAGWSWSHDEYVRGGGTPIGWMPLPALGIEVQP